MEYSDIEINFIKNNGTAVKQAIFSFIVNTYRQGGKASNESRAMLIEAVSNLMMFISNEDRKNGYIKSNNDEIVDELINVLTDFINNTYSQYEKAPKGAVEMLPGAVRNLISVINYSDLKKRKHEEIKLGL